MNVKLSAEQKIQVLNGKDLAMLMHQVLMRENKIGRNQEHFWIVCLASNNRILLIELIGLGSVNAVPVEPMEVFSFALQKRAVKIILVHNHPSGEVKPSENDLQVTEKMIAIGDFVRVPVLDHLIITENEYFSFNGAGLMDQIRRETTFDLTFEKQTQLKQQMNNLRSMIAENQKKAEQKLANAHKLLEKNLKQLLEKEKQLAEAQLAIANKNKEMALSLLQNGVDVNVVMKSTGLTPKEIDELVEAK